MNSALRLAVCVTLAAACAAAPAQEAPPGSAATPPRGATQPQAENQPRGENPPRAENPPPTTALAESAAQHLLAHGSDDRFWVARVGPGKGKDAPPTETTLHVRDAGQGRWRPLKTIAARVTGMAHRGTQLALLLDDGNWLLVSDESTATGRPLPQAGRVLSLGSDNDRLLAVARIDAAAEAFTRPASRPAAPETARAEPAPPTPPEAASPTPATPTAPAVAPRATAAPDPKSTATPTSAPVPSTALAAGPRLALLELGQGGWAEVGALPDAVTTEGVHVSLAAGGTSRLLAVGDGRRSVRLFEHAAPAGWTEVGRFKAPFEVARLKLLGGAPVPVVLTVGPAGQTLLHWLKTGGTVVVAASLPDGTTAKDVAATYAAGKVRLLYVSPADGAILEQTYDALTGAADGAAVPIVFPRPPIDPAFTQWMRPVLTAALLFTILSSIRRRREMQEVVLDPQRLPLAPVGRRLLAGLIDASPILITIVALRLMTADAGNDAARLEDPRVQIALLASMGLYLLHTSLAELLAGRSFGKLCCGLRVVGLDGQPAGPGPLLLRNALRVIDLSMAFFPLVLVLFSPLRQRAGDVAAGTLVVTTRSKRDEANVVEEAAKTK